jgi:trans-aconitate 2-methyltransferase
MNDWNPALYMRFEDERTRAARDLLAQVPPSSQSLIYDLGCGPGNSAELLLQRYPEAQVFGIDTSDAMLAHARIRAPQARFLKQDIAQWEPSGTPNLIFANSALHFLPDHFTLFPRLVSFLEKGGCLAVQMPNNVREASHALMRMLAAEGPWTQRLVPVAKTRPVIASFSDYYEWLRPVSAHIVMWQTTYLHPLDGPQGIADWFAGSSLQPFLEPLDGKERDQFLTRYRQELADAYPRQSDGTVLLQYPRLFIVATR